VLFGDGLLHGLPLHAEGRVRQAVVEALAGKLVVRQGVAKLELGHVVALYQLIGHADGIGLGVELLAVGDEGCLVVPLLNLLDGRAQEAARARRAVIHGAHDALASEQVVIRGKD
jgi:hypothetical protein